MDEEITPQEDARAEALEHNRIAREARQIAYIQNVDPITAEIQRLKDDDPTSPRIEEAEAERAAFVAAIIKRYAYVEVPPEVVTP